VASSIGPGYGRLVNRLVYFSCAFLALGLVGTARGDSAQSRLPSRTLFQVKAADGTSYELDAQFLRQGGERHIAYSVHYERVVSNPDGSEDVESGGSLSDHLAARGRKAFRLDSIFESTACRDDVVFGSVVHSVTRVVAVRADGTTRVLRRQRPPRSWHYKGWLIGAFVGDGPATIRVRVFGRDGRSLGSYRVPNESNPACHHAGA
jgi:hypothetical protein